MSPCMKVVCHFPVPWKMWARGPYMNQCKASAKNIPDNVPAVMASFRISDSGENVFTGDTKSLTLDNCVPVRDTDLLPLFQRHWLKRDPEVKRKLRLGARKKAGLEKASLAGNNQSK